MQGEDDRHRDGKIEGAGRPGSGAVVDSVLSGAAVMSVGAAERSPDGRETMSWDVLWSRLWGLWTVLRATLTG